MPLTPRPKPKRLVDRSLEKDRFARLSPDQRAVMSDGHSAPLELKPAIQLMREQRERGVVI